MWFVTAARNGSVVVGLSVSAQNPSSPPGAGIEGTAMAYQAMCNAGLCDKETALREARQAQELCPKSGDLTAFTQVGRIIAVVYAWCGDHAGALDQLEAIIDLPESVDARDLRLNPQWDELRGEVRFQQIILRAAKPVKID
jgi:hypothetical protein